MNRKKAAEVAQETLVILATGSYEVEGRRIELGAELQDAVLGTTAWPPGGAPRLPAQDQRPTRIEVRNETTMEAARRLAEGGADVVALNFASAKHPGGGFLGGSRAQEESLARSSGLYACLVNQPMYDFHNRQNDPMYSHYAIHSPGVPFFREDGGALLAAPWRCSVITCPAVNAGVVLQRRPGAEGRIREVMEERTERVLRLAAHFGHDALVLGAWGCGVFGNDPEVVSELFRVALEGPFRGVFAQVVFAVLDTSADGRFIEPFGRRFGGIVS